MAPFTEALFFAGVSLFTAFAFNSISFSRVRTLSTSSLTGFDLVVDTVDALLFLDVDDFDLYTFLLVVDLFCLRSRCLSWARFASASARFACVNRMLCFAFFWFQFFGVVVASKRRLELGL